MDWLADTVTVIRHFSGTGRIGRKAKTILEGVEEGDHHMFLSTVSLVEIFYLSEKNRIMINLLESLDIIDDSPTGRAKYCPNRRPKCNERGPLRAMVSHTPSTARRNRLLDRLWQHRPNR